MKKILCVILMATLMISSVSVAYAKQPDRGAKTKQQTTQQQTTQQKTTQQKENSIKQKKQSFKIDGKPMIKYGKFKLPLSPITKGMGATVTFDKETALLTVVKDTNKIVIDFKNKTVTINGVADTKSGIFTAKKNKKTTVLIKYIAKVLGVRVNVGKEKITVEVPGLNLPTNVTVTPVGSTVVTNVLNSTTLYMTATANITVGQATGGKAELYVGSKLVATDATIDAADTTVTFTTSDGSPVNAELQVAVPQGGVVTVKLYNASSQSVTSNVANPTLTVDYVAPTISSITNGVYTVSGSSILVAVTGAGIVGDIVDVTKVSLYDTTLAKTYQLTNTAAIGSIGVITSDTLLTINLGSTDVLGLTGFGGTTVVLTIAPGALLKDAAGNISSEFTTTQTIPVTIIK